MEVIDPGSEGPSAAVRRRAWRVETDALGRRRHHRPGEQWEWRGLRWRCWEQEHARSRDPGGD